MSVLVVHNLFLKALFLWLRKGWGMLVFLLSTFLDSFGVGVIKRVWLFFLLIFFSHFSMTWI